MSAGRRCLAVIGFGVAGGLAGGCVGLLIGEGDSSSRRAEATSLTYCADGMLNNPNTVNYLCRAVLGPKRLDQLSSDPEGFVDDVQGRVDWLNGVADKEDHGVEGALNGAIGGVLGAVSMKLVLDLRRNTQPTPDASTPSA